MNEQNRPIAIDTRDDLDALLVDEDVVLLEFWSVGCGICASMDPVLDVLARQTDATIVTCNPEQDVDLIAEYDVTSVPALLLFVDGEEVDRRMEGFVGADELREMIATHVPDAVPADSEPAV